MITRLIRHHSKLDECTVLDGYTGQGITGWMYSAGGKHWMGVQAGWIYRGGGGSVSEMTVVAP